MCCCETKRTEYIVVPYGALSHWYLIATALIRVCAALCTQTKHRIIHKLPTEPRSKTCTIYQFLVTKENATMVSSWFMCCCIVALFATFHCWKHRQHTPIHVACNENNLLSCQNNVSLFTHTLQSPREWIHVLACCWLPQSPSIHEIFWAIVSTGITHNENRTPNIRSNMCSSFILFHVRK